MGRVATVTNPLGVFTNAYDGDTNVLEQTAFPMAGLSVQYARGPVAAGFKLTEIYYEGPGNAEIARFGYTYDAGGEIATWNQTQPGLSPGRQLSFQYDAAKQMTSVVEAPLLGSPPNPQVVWRYQYDDSGNRQLSQENHRTNAAVFNNLNQMTNLQQGGSTWFRGQVNEAANVSVGGQAAKVSNAGVFEAVLSLGTGVHDVAMQATDNAGNSVNETWRVDNGSNSPQARTFDAEGNLLSNGTRTHTWDAMNRMTSITMGGDSWEFTYDGNNRRIGEKKNGINQTEWVWNDTGIREERLADGSKRRFWTGGIELLDASNVQTGKRFLLTDHLGSARVALDASGSVVASYDYGIWGKRVRLAGTEEVPDGYTGHSWHESGLSFAVHRVYDPEAGGWLSRDRSENEAASIFMGWWGIIR